MRFPRSLRTVLVGILFATTLSTAFAATERGYFRDPAIYGETVVFLAEGDLWSVAVGGGTARRLTTHPGVESSPAISPDGKWLAYSATYEGPRELYVMPLTGGLPKRLTWHGSRGRGASPVGWTADGRITYATSAFSGIPETQLVTVDPTTSHSKPVPLAQAADGVWNDAGDLWFVRYPFQGSNAKRYKGGTAEQLWFFGAGAEEAQPMLPDYVGISKSPMIVGGRLAFLCDRDGTMNLYSTPLGPNATELAQHTSSIGWDIREAASDGKRIVYRVGADLHWIDLADGSGQKIPIRLASDFERLREQWIEKPMNWLSSGDISPDGDRVVLTARGELFVLPSGKDGRRIRVTHAPGVRYRSAHFLDDKTLLALSDASGEVEWWKLPADGIGEPQQVTRDGDSLRFDGVLSPDGKWVVHHNRQNELWLTKIADGQGRKLADSQWGFSNDAAWSPDSMWLAYVNAGENALSRIFLHNVDSEETVAATSDRYDSGDPVFSPDGKWLWLLSNRRFVSEVGSPWGSRQPDPYFSKQTQLYAVALDTEARFPFLAKNELTVDDKKDAEKDDDKDKKGQEKDKKKKDEKKPVEVRIETEGLADRLHLVPAGHGDRSDLGTDGKRLYWVEEGNLKSIEIKRHAEVETTTEKITGYNISADNKKILLRQGESLYVLDPGKKIKPDKDHKVDLSGWSFAIDPREEFRQLYFDAWRLHRDYFYDPGMHGVDWEKMRDRYLPLVDRVTDRYEIADIQAMLISELSALHASVSSGDARTGDDRIDVATLGARLETEADGWRIAHIYRTDPDRPVSASPLARPGVEAVEGDLITAIDGQSAAGTVPGPALRNKAGRDVRLTLQTADGKTKETIVQPISAFRDYGLRYDEWEYTRRLQVEESSENDIGYVHMRAMGRSNMAEWYREFYPVFDRKGLIIDVRHNRGGNIDSWILGKLLRRDWMYWQSRVGGPTWNMQTAFRGHMVVLVDAWTASDGEAFADGFRRLGLGPVIGVRSWGGEIWLTSSNRQVDGGIARAAEFGVYADGEWLIEGIGVIPDMVEDNLPHATWNGRDAQLERAIQYLQQKIIDDPRPIPEPPPFPDKSSEDNRKGT
jgi:tricorn protease